jgi:protease I
METGALRGRTVTSWPSLKTDLKNAGANWVDQEVARDGQFITSRKPEDIPAFTRAIIELVSGNARLTRAA